MAVTKKSPGYQVDGRVSIGLDALDEKEKQAVGGIITDRAHFLASTADSRKVQKLSRDRPLYALKVPSGLRIIFSRVGEEIVVMDLMRQATLDDFGRKASRTRAGGRRKARPASHPNSSK